MDKYQQILNYLYSQLPMYQRTGPASYKIDLKKSLELDKHFNHPHKNFKSIHIAGTNGKGSVAHTLASILQEAGYKTGLYTSPHLLDFRERIKINGQKIDKQYIIDFVEQNKHFFEKIKPSFFEMTVAMAFKYFSDMNVDIAVIEVGLGGRLDATNIITPLVSVITSIGYDHMQFLGSSLTQIAKEKAGIIKNNVPVVLGNIPNLVRQVFLQIASEKDAPIHLANLSHTISNFSITSDNKLIMNVLVGGKLTYPNLIFGLSGTYQIDNVPAILKTIEIINQTPYFNISKSAIYSGFKNVVENTGLFGRWQVIDNKPKIILDIAHNQDAIKKVVENLRFQNFKNLHIVFGMVNDKNSAQILRLLPKNAKYYFVTASVPRSKPAETLLQEAQNYNLNARSFQTVEQGLTAAQNNAKPDDLILITGSAFVVADALKHLGYN